MQGSAARRGVAASAKREQPLLRFGDIGGGVTLNDQWDWITETTGLSLVPEPSQYALLLGWATLLCIALHRRAKPWRTESPGA